MTPVVLVVDDHRENLLAFEAALAPLVEQEGVRVVLAASAEEALRHALAEGNELAVVLLDVMMPGIDGPETARLIRQRRQTAHVPVVFVTALDADQARLAGAYAAGAVDYLRKPVDSELLRAKVAAFVDLYRRQADQRTRERRRFADEARAVSERAAADATEARGESAAARARLAAVLDSLPDTVATFDADWRVRYVNPTAAERLRATGRDPDAVLGRVLWELATELVGTRFETEFRRAAAERQVVAFEAYRADRGVWLDIRVVPGPDGTVTLFARDVTPRMEAERARQESEAQLAGIIGSAMDAIITADEARHIVVFNAAAERMFGVPAADAIGQSLDRFVPPRYRDVHASHMRAFGAGGATTRDMRTTRHGVEPLAALRADGTEFPVEATISQITVGARRLYTVVLRDVTERVAAEAERAHLLAETEAARSAAEGERAAAEAARAIAEEANASKSRFLARMSHELRTPLNAIGGHVQLVTMGIHGPVTPEQREALARVDRAQRHLLTHINDILNYAKLESGRVEYDIRPTRLGDVIAGVAALIEPQLAEKGLALDLPVWPTAGPDTADPAETPESSSIAGPEAEAWADRDKLAQVLINLLSNALKFTAPGGRLAVEVAAHPTEPQLVQLRVADTGRGIAPDRLAAIFEPFVQAHRDVASTQQGTGLGLAISRDLARGMGGDLSVESTEGVGSTFTVTLRRVTTAGGATPDRRATGPGAAGRRAADARRGG